jgi:hypothetical protein
MRKDFLIIGGTALIRYSSTHNTQDVDIAITPQTLNAFWERQRVILDSAFTCLGCLACQHRSNEGPMHTKIDVRIVTTKTCCLHLARCKRRDRHCFCLFSCTDPKSPPFGSLTRFSSTTISSLFGLASPRTYTVLSNSHPPLVGSATCVACILFQPLMLCDKCLKIPRDCRNVRRGMWLTARWLTTDMRQEANVVVSRPGLVCAEILGPGSISDSSGSCRTGLSASQN